MVFGCNAEFIVLLFSGKQNNWTCSKKHFGTCPIIQKGGVDLGFYQREVNLLHLNFYSSTQISANVNAKMVQF